MPAASHLKPTARPALTPGPPSPQPGSAARFPLQRRAPGLRAPLRRAPPFRPAGGSSAPLEPPLFLSLSPCRLVLALSGRPLSFRFVCSRALRLSLLRYPLRSIAAGSLSWFALPLFLPVLPGRRPPLLPTIAPSSDTLFRFLCPLLRCLLALVFFPRISLPTPSPPPPPPSAPSAGCSAPGGDPGRPAGTQARGWILPDAARPAQRLSRVPVPGGAASGWDQRSRANCFSLSPNCGFYQESPFQRAQTRSAAAALISSADPLPPPPRTPTAGRAQAGAARPLHGGPRAPAGRRRGGPISGDPALGLSSGVRQRPDSCRSARAVGAVGTRTRLPGRGMHAPSREVARSTGLGAQNSGRREEAGRLLQRPRRRRRSGAGKPSLREGGHRPAHPRAAGQSEK